MALDTSPLAWDTVHDGRETFLTCLRAFCAPGTPVGPLPLPRRSDDPAADTAVAVLFSLLDPGLTFATFGAQAVALTEVLAASGAVPTTVDRANFVVASEDAAAVLASARRGERDRPELGATVILVGDAAEAQTPVALTGPGLATRTVTTLPISAATIDAFMETNADEPCGVDLIIAEVRRITALPRSCSVEKEVG